MDQDALRREFLARLEDTTADFKAVLTVKGKQHGAREVHMAVQKFSPLGDEALEEFAAHLSCEAA